MGSDPIFYLLHVAERNVATKKWGLTPPVAEKMGSDPAR